MCVSSRSNYCLLHHHPPHTLQVYGEGKALPYVVPSPNVRIECPLALVDKVLEGRPAAAREAAHAFANFLFTSDAQVGGCCACDGELGCLCCEMVSWAAGWLVHRQENDLRG